jgi:hypothetical protein
MTKKQFKRAAAVIRKDAELQMSYFSRDGRTCVIGGLLKAAKFRLSRIPAKSNHAMIHATYEHRALIPAIDRLAREFGLSVNRLSQLQRINDEVDDIRARRMALITKLRTFID